MAKKPPTKPGQGERKKAQGLARPQAAPEGLSVANLFVYGTLKKGFPNHERFFPRCVGLEAASMAGNLFASTPFFPVMEIPPENVLMVGSLDVLADLRAASLSRPGARKPKGPRERARYGRVLGEVIAVEEPVSVIKSLDILEGFEPGGRSLYKRVLTLAETESGTVVAWAYVNENARKEELIESGVWL
jgi:gamma-glutamylcyclotransferase (GGCT)/AIG2-like uncharacterized protein YtfP